jgi:hypothetical protein
MTRTHILQMYAISILNGSTNLSVQLLSDDSRADAVSWTRMHLKIEKQKTTNFEFHRLI